MQVEVVHFKGGKRDGMQVALPVDAALTVYLAYTVCSGGHQHFEEAYTRTDGNIFVFDEVLTEKTMTRYDRAAVAAYN